MVRMTSTNGRNQEQREMWNRDHEERDNRRREGRCEIVASPSPHGLDVKSGAVQGRPSHQLCTEKITVMVVKPCFRTQCSVAAAFGTLVQTVARAKLDGRHDAGASRCVGCRVRH